MNPEFPAPKVFISYAWESDAVKDWVKKLGTELRNVGIDVQLDQWHVQPGDRMALFMEMAVRTNNYVLVICTPKYKYKSENRLGGVGYEGDIMTAEVLQNSDYRKFIPILQSGDSRSAIPSWLATHFFLDFSNPLEYQKTFDELIETLLDLREKAPPLGEIPAKYQKAIREAVQKQTETNEENVPLESSVVNEAFTKEEMQNERVPLLEVDLVWHGSSRSPRGYSDKNPTEIDENGRLVTIIGAGVKPIIYWDLHWRFDFVIQNSSSFPAFNVQLESLGDVHFATIEKIANVNHIKPFDKMELKADYRQSLEGIHTAADDILKYKIPEKLEGLLLKLTYLDEQRNKHFTLVKIEENKIVNIMKRFWEVIYDDEHHKMEVIGESVDDTLLTENIVLMQHAGMKVRCNTADISTPKDNINLPNYQIENGLYQRLIKEYESKTGQRLKLW
ncbi:TIR domain-containing protein [Mucilaginibacter sp. HC2]|uniref:toll/interleukin-1 receptor domain-containing protein n=1 Tax=Mucilaginibacter inviolabilis TaxID=2714892 RepID=UPI001409BAD9|nr:toll/interleukin-1 receptor domain-containing protein [Mucilaginibacter inviolabilis]NHA03306.1 TIR domain-containing protein [Mucilaginibacter inviolabilis]